MSFFLFARHLMGDIPILVNLRSGALVLVGTIVGGLLAFPVHTLRGFFTSLFDSLKPKSKPVEALITQIVALARVQRLAGLREMDRTIDAVPNPVLRRGFQMILDNYNAARVEMTLGNEIQLYLDQLQSQLNVINRLARLAPVFGFVGTIIGLIDVLNHIGSSAQIGQGMATALLTTFYGLLFANFVFLPIAGKFAEHIRREALMLNVVFDGVLAVCNKRPPLEIAHSLKSYMETNFSTPPSPVASRKRSRWNPWGASAKQQGLAR